MQEINLKDINNLKINDNNLESEAYINYMTNQNHIIS